MSPPEERASGVQGRVGPYTIVELTGEGRRGSVFELQAGSIRKDQQGVIAGKDISFMDETGLCEGERLQCVEVNINNGVDDNIASTPQAEMDASGTRGIDEIQPNPRTSKYSSRCLKNRDRKHNSAPTPESTIHPRRDTSPPESTSMLCSASSDLPEVIVTRPTSLPLLQNHLEYESIPRQANRMADADLEALAGAFAPPSLRAKPKPRIGPLVYR